MPVEVILPKVDMDMTVGTIAAWHAADGDRVEKDAPLFDIETDKAAMEVESPASGFLHHICAEIGAEVTIGTPVAWIYAEGETVGEAPLVFVKRPVFEEVPRDRDEPAAQREDAPTLTDKTRATPAARRLAASEGLDIAEVAGCGPRGRVQAADVERMLKGPEPDRSWQSARGPLNVLYSGGGDGLPIVMIHGFGADGGGWKALEEALPPGHPLFKIELSAHGRSPLSRIDGFRDLAAAVREAFDALQLDCVHLIGHSLGGALALALSATRARKIDGLTLIAPAGLGPEINGDALFGLARATKVESLRPWMQQLVADPGVITERFAKAAMQSRRDANLRAAQHHMAEALFPDGVQAFDMTVALKELDCPARIVWGRRDRMIPWRHALQAPGTVALHLLEDVGHLPHLERPELLAGLMRDLR